MQPAAQLGARRAQAIQVCLVLSLPLWSTEAVGLGLWALNAGRRSTPSSLLFSRSSVCVHAKARAAYAAYRALRVILIENNDQAVLQRGSFFCFIARTHPCHYYQRIELSAGYMCLTGARIALLLCRNTMQSMAKIAKDEGAAALWKGYTAKVVRLGPGGGIMLVVFEACSAYIR